MDQITFSIHFLFRPGQQPQLVQTIQQNPQIVQIQQQQNQQQPVQMQQVTVQQQQPQVQAQQRKGLTLSVRFCSNLSNEIYFDRKNCNFYLFKTFFAL